MYVCICLAISFSFISILSRWHTGSGPKEGTSKPFEIHVYIYTCTYYKIDILFKICSISLGEKCPIFKDHHFSQARWALHPLAADPVVGHSLCHRLPRNGQGLRSCEAVATGATSATDHADPTSHSAAKGWGKLGVLAGWLAWLGRLVGESTFTYEYSFWQWSHPSGKILKAFLIFLR